MTKRSVFSLPLYLIIACICGCGTGSKSANPTNTPDSSRSSTMETTTNPGNNFVLGSEETPTAPPSDNSKTEIDDSAFSPKVPSDPNTPPVPNSNPPDIAPPAASEESTTRQSAQISPQPSSQQIARWVSPEFEPLQLLACRESPEVGLVSHMADANDGDQFITAGTKVILWSSGSETPVHVFWEGSGELSAKSLAVSPNGKWFVVGDSEGMIRMWSVAERKEVNAKQLYANDIIHIAISPDGQEICTISYDDEITLWSAQRLEQKNRFKVDTDGLKKIEFISNDLIVAAGQTTSLWNVRTGKLDRLISPGRYQYTLARSPDGKRLLFGEGDVLSLKNLSDVDELSPKVSLLGGFASDENVAFSGDGGHLATANGSSLRIWDLTSGQLLQVVDVFGWPISGLNWLPNSNLLIVCSLNGRTRLWGTRADGQKLAMQPLHAEIVMPNLDVREPATPPQLMSTVDLRTFPRLAGGVPSVNSDFSLSYECPESIEDAKLFYRYQLGKRGWSEVPQEVDMPHMVTFQKDGFRITTSYYDGSQSKTMIMVTSVGNYDLRWIPKLESAPIELVYENEDTVMYRTNANVVDIETSLLRILPQAGWTAYSRLNSGHSEEDDRRHLLFLRGSMTLNITFDRDPSDSTKFNVQYSGNYSTRTIPVPPDSGYVEFDGSTQPMLVATTGMNLEGARTYYDQKMVAEGWLSREFGRSTKDADHNWLAYVRGQQDLTVGLERLPNGRTRVTVGENVQKTSWQFAKETPPNEGDAALPGIEAADFPVLNESKFAKFDAIAKSIEISMDETPLIKVGELYKQSLQEIGWTQDGAGIIEADYVFMTFTRDRAEIEMRARVADGKSVVNVQGDGILWNKPLSGNKRIISYETWLRVNHHPATLELLDQYRTEMQ